MSPDASSAKTPQPRGNTPSLQDPSMDPLVRVNQRLQQLEVILDFQRRNCRLGELIPQLLILTEDSLRYLPHRPWLSLDITDVFADPSYLETFASTSTCLLENMGAVAAVIVTEAWSLEGLTSEELAEYDEGRAKGIYRHMGEHPLAQSNVLVLYQDPEITISRTYRTHPLHLGGGLVLPAALDSTQQPEAIAQYGFDMFPLPMGECPNEPCTCKD